MSINIALLQSAGNIGQCGFSLGLRLQDIREVLYSRCYTTLRQALQEQSPVALGLQARVEHRQHTTIRRAANQPPQSLLQTDNCLRHAVLKKARATFIFNVTLARRHNRISWHSERQLVDDHARQLLAAHVHSLPETRGSKQHAIRSLAKSFQQTSF